MAKIFPTLENINRLKVKPTDGEMFLLSYLKDNFDEDDEIYFQPFLNGDRPDIIVVRKDIGAIVIEVKDWNLNSYHIDIKNKWYLNTKNQVIKSPYQQVYAYKHNLFNLHINGLLEKKLKNINFYKLIRPYVYFYGASRKDVANLFSEAIEHYKSEINLCNASFREKAVRHDIYEKKYEQLNNKKNKLERDANQNTIVSENLNKISFPESLYSGLFSESVYHEFQRYLQPPYHTKSQGIDIKYEKKQSQIIVSKPVHQKVKGVAGSGKTAVLAKRAVNAHKRHGEEVLILSFNLTLKNYIHDRVSDVREDFSWSAFYITNYHQLITQETNNLNIIISLPEDTSEKDKSSELDKRFYSNIDVFKDKEHEIRKYKSIFVDEIQDYKPEWIKIIRKYFLEDDGEMVLFGDEKQNIYERDINDNKKSKTVQGFGEWVSLNKSIRHQSDSHILGLAKNFQKRFFDEKYEIDEYQENVSQPSLHGVGLNKISHHSQDDLMGLVSTIFKNIKAEKIHPNDVCILSSHVNILIDIDFIIRNEFNEKTLTTFESKEMRGTNIYGVNVENVRKARKAAFNLNSGVLKLSTIHSFKGYESPTVFLIVDDKNSAEMVYAGITRAKFNIMVFTNKESKYNEFFTSELEKD